MSDITYKRISNDETLIYEDGKVVGDVFRHHDCLNPGAFVFFVHITEDPRGAHLVPSGTAIDTTVKLALETHPLFS